MDRITSEHVIGKLKGIFARWGVPESLKTDNGRQFTSDTFQKFAVDYNFRQVFSSPYHAQANGEAASALMAYRSTPVQSTGVNPAQLPVGGR